MSSNDSCILLYGEAHWEVFLNSLFKEPTLSNNDCSGHTVKLFRKLSVFKQQTQSVKGAQGNNVQAVQDVLLVQT